MKLSNLFQPARAMRSALLAALTLLSVGASQAANFFFDPITASGTGGGTVDFGTVRGGPPHCWAIFSLSGGVTVTDAVLGAPTDYDVVGNIGIANGGTLLIDRARIGGTTYLRNGAVANILGGATTTGGILTNQNLPVLNAAAGAAFSAASAASSLASNTAGGTLSISGPPIPGGVLTNGSFLDTATIGLTNVTGGGTITGLAGQTYVMNLTNLILAGNLATLTLSGTATTNYIINVSRFMSLSGGAKIQLSGGLTEANVLYNVRNSAGFDVTMSGGSEVSGIILATNRNVKLTGDSKVFGQVVARSVSLSGSSNVINPLCSP